MERRIAKIESTVLGWEDHGILTCWLRLDYGGSGQGAGGYTLDEPRTAEGLFTGRTGTAYGMEFIARLMKACGVQKWEDLRGRTVYAIIGDGLVRGLAPLPTESGAEFLFGALFDEMYPEGVPAHD